jgi:hypothetical protein
MALVMQDIPAGSDWSQGYAPTRQSLAYQSAAKSSDLTDVPRVSWPQATKLAYLTTNIYTRG